jgi:hypothetical protein
MEVISKSHPVIAAAIENHHPQVYLEVGLANALHFAKVKAPKKIGVDIARPANINRLVNSNVLFFQMDSIAFMKEHYRLLYDIDMAFVDGLHDYHQVYQECMLLMTHIKRKR